MKTIAILALTMRFGGNLFAKTVELTKEVIEYGELA